MVIATRDLFNAANSLLLCANSRRAVDRDLELGTAVAGHCREHAWAAGTYARASATGGPASSTSPEALPLDHLVGEQLD